MSVAFLSLGSNLGDREKNLAGAINLLASREDTQVLDISSIYETDPVGFLEQGPFLNLVCRVNTSLAPRELLAAVKEIEKELVRVPTVRNGPRTIDLDILMYDNRKEEHPDLIIPHPRMFERAFVMIPLFELLQPELFPGSNLPSVRRFGTLTGISQLNATEKRL